VIGTPTPDQQRLLAGTKKALDAAIATIRDGVRVGDIGAAVESTLERYDLACIYELCGHGVGHQVHEDPIIPNYGTAGTGEALRTGMTVALEPNVSLGSHEMYLAEDGWTWTTKDHSLSTQAEHTVLVTDDGCEILTQL
jgi:methionyl aminopeptidase